MAAQPAAIAVKPSAERRDLLLVVLAIAVFAVLMAFGLMQLWQIERDARANDGEDVVWALAQTQYEIQRLLLATTPGRHSSADDIGLRLDITLSRLRLLEEGPMAERLAVIGWQGVIERLHTDLSRLEPLIAQSGDQVERYSARLYRTMQQYLTAIGSIANELMIESKVREADRRLGYAASSVQAIVSMLGIMACGVFLIVRLLQSLRRAHEAETKVRREKTFLGQLLEASGEGIAAFDAQGNCTHWNEGMTMLFGSTDLETIDRPAEGAEMFLGPSALEKALAGEPVYIPALPYGNGLHLESAISPLRHNGVVTGAIVVVHDVTERHQALKERQLREVYRDFVSMVSHQFRTHLAVIDSSIQRVMRRGTRMDETELGRRARTIREATAELAQLIESTLAAERIDAGAMDLALRPADLVDLLQATCARFADLFPGRLAVGDLSALQEPVICDSVLVNQALTNLIGNGLKYSPEASPVHIGAGQTASGVFISITDAGPGIAEGERERIFERFHRSQDTSMVEGSGIGLYAARQIARLHGGDITLATAPGAGSTFTLTLPLVPSQAAA